MTKFLLKYFSLSAANQGKNSCDREAQFNDPEAAKDFCLLNASDVRNPALYEPVSGFGNTHEMKRLRMK